MAFIPKSIGFSTLYQTMQPTTEIELAPDARSLNLPRAMGHEFNDVLICRKCAQTLARHTDSPRECRGETSRYRKAGIRGSEIRRMERSARRALREAENQQILALIRGGVSKKEIRSLMHVGSERIKAIIEGARHE